MDRIEALGLESEVRYALTSHKHKEAVDFAFAALQEQEQGEQGCEFCTMEYDIPLPTDMSYTWISGNELQNAYGSCEIKFCPMCGRKLGGAD